MSQPVLPTGEGGEAELPGAELGALCGGLRDSLATFRDGPKDFCDLPAFGACYGTMGLEKR